MIGGVLSILAHVVAMSSDRSRHGPSVLCSICSPISSRVSMNNVSDSAQCTQHSLRRGARGKGHVASTKFQSPLSTHFCCSLSCHVWFLLIVRFSATLCSCSQERTWLQECFFCSSGGPHAGTLIVRSVSLPKGTRGARFFQRRALVLRGFAKFRAWVKGMSRASILCAVRATNISKWFLSVMGEEYM